MKKTLSGNSTLMATKNQLCCDLRGEAVILGLKSGVYYGLNDVGARIWSLVQESRTVNEIRDSILTEYEVEPERCERELLVLLQKLVDKEFVEIKNETNT